MPLQMKYFVLKPSGDSAYSVASRYALQTYAKIIKDFDKELSANLLEWVDAEWEKCKLEALRNPRSSD